MINTRLVLARISPVNYLQRLILKRKRQRTLRKVFNQKVYLLQIEVNKLEAKLRETSNKWKRFKVEVDKGYRTISEKLSKMVSDSEINSAKNFIKLIEVLNNTKDINLQIAALEKICSKVEEFEIESVKKGKKSVRNQLKFFGRILNHYLSKLQAEIEYWQLSDKLEEIKLEMNKLELKSKSVNF